VTIAKDMKKKVLNVPKVICLKASEEIQEASTISITEVNLVAAGLSHFQHIQNGTAKSLVVLEDPANRDEFTVLPRTLPQVSADALEAKEKIEWTFEASVFKDYHRDDEAGMSRAFDVDWRNGRLGQIIRDHEAKMAVEAYLREHYLQIVLCFMRISFHHFASKTVQPACSLLLSATGL